MEETNIDENEDEKQQQQFGQLLFTPPPSFIWWWWWWRLWRVRRRRFPRRGRRGRRRRRRRRFIFFPWPLDEAIAAKETFLAAQQRQQHVVEPCCVNYRETSFDCPDIEVYFSALEDIHLSVGAPALFQSPQSRWPTPLIEVAILDGLQIRYRAGSGDDDDEICHRPRILEHDIRVEADPKTFQFRLVELRPNALRCLDSAPVLLQYHSIPAVDEPIAQTNSVPDDDDDIDPWHLYVQLDADTTSVVRVEHPIRMLDENHFNVDIVLHEESTAVPWRR